MPRLFTTLLVFFIMLFYFWRIKFVCLCYYSSSMQLRNYSSVASSVLFGSEVILWGKLTTTRSGPLACNHNPGCEMIRWLITSPMSHATRQQSCQMIGLYLPSSLTGANPFVVNPSYLPITDEHSCLTSHKPCSCPSIEVFTRSAPGRKCPLGRPQKTWLQKMEEDTSLFIHHCQC